MYDILRKAAESISWAYTRVKLHSQVHFESKKILGPKNELGPKSFNFKKILGSVITWQLGPNHVFVILSRRRDTIMSVWYYVSHRRDSIMSAW